MIKVKVGQVWKSSYTNSILTITKTKIKDGLCSVIFRDGSYLECFRILNFHDGWSLFKNQCINDCCKDVKK